MLVKGVHQPQQPDRVKSPQRLVAVETAARRNAIITAAREKNLQTWQQGHCLQNPNDAAAAAAAALGSIPGQGPKEVYRFSSFNFHLNLTEQVFVFKKIAFGSVGRTWRCTWYRGTWYLVSCCSCCHDIQATTQRFRLLNAATKPPV
jgi:hypothetical protein